MMNKLDNVWVFSDMDNRYAELLAAAHQLGNHVTALVVGDGRNTDSLWQQGADAVGILDAPQPDEMIENYAQTLFAALVQSPLPIPLLLLAATRRGKALGAKLSVLLDAALVNDATHLALDGHQVIAQHRVFGGLAFGQEKIHTPVAIVTLSPGNVEPLPMDSQKTGVAFHLDYVKPRNPLVCLERRAKPGSNVDLVKAKRVVGVGRGLATQEDLSMIRDLAGLLHAEVGCSRPIAEGEHWMERERYIGVSGVSLKADLYLMLGISGQIQHMVGANGAKTIIAINKDKNAPIFQNADYGLVADIYKAVPALIEQLKL